MLVADTGRKRILRLSAEGDFKGVAAAPGAPANLDGPTDAVELASGEIVVCDSASSRLVLFDASGAFKRVIASPGKGPNEVSHPFSMALDAEGNLLTVDTLNRRLVCRGQDLAVTRVVRPKQGDDLLFVMPSFIAVERDGNLLVADDGRSCVFRLTVAGPVRLGMEENQPQVFSRVSGVAAMPDGTILVSDAARHVLVRFDAEGRKTGTIGAGHSAARYAVEVWWRRASAVHRELPASTVRFAAWPRVRS